MSEGVEQGSLLKYYQHRAAAADAERAELLQRVEACSGPSSAEVYSLQAENRKRTNEVRELQKALSDAHTYLFEERERLLALQAENDALRLQEVEDRARIKQLLSLTRPTEEKVVYGSGQPRPHTSAVLPRTAAAGPSRGRSPRRGTTGGGGANCAGDGLAAALPSQAPQRILRTVYLPMAEGEALSLRCEALAAQLQEQKRFAAERVAALQEDRSIRERDAAAAAAALSAANEQLAEKLQAAQQALRLTTKDCIVARQQRDAAEEAAALARAEAEAGLRHAEAALERAEAQAAAALQQQQAELEGDGCKEVQALQEQLCQRGEELLKFETVHKLLRSQLEARAADAERRARRAAAAARQLHLRRAQEVQGWASDVGQLRKRIAGVERRLAGLRLAARMPDDERRDAALARHARLCPEGPRAFDYECGLDELVAELLTLKDALLSMGHRAREVALRQAEEAAGGD